MICDYIYCKKKQQEWYIINTNHTCDDDREYKTLQKARKDLIGEPEVIME